MNQQNSDRIINILIVVLFVGTFIYSWHRAFLPSDTLTPAMGAESEITLSPVPPLEMLSPNGKPRIGAGLQYEEAMPKNKITAAESATVADTGTALIPTLPRMLFINCGPTNAPNSWRNWLCAIYKGNKYAVDPALLVAIRTHENPSRSRDHFALGVVAYKGTDIWEQYEQGAKIVARIADRQDWDASNPRRGDLYRLGLVYVGRGAGAARHWQGKVWAVYQRERTKVRVVH